MDNPDTAGSQCPIDLVSQVQQFRFRQMLDNVKCCDGVIRIIRRTFKKRKSIRLSNVRETKLPRLPNLFRRAINARNILITSFTQKVEKSATPAAKVQNSSAPV